VPASAESATLEDRILGLIGPSPTAEDQVIRDLSADAMRFAEAVLQLELDGRIQRHPGGLLSRAEAA
jgi:DNA processing protein